MEEIITTDFWEELWTKGQGWIITELPGLIIIILVLIVVSRFTRFVLRKLKNTLISRAEKKETHDVAEAEKRIKTLIGIIGGVVSIFLWTVFIMIALKNLELKSHQFLPVQVL